jgi:hypothetical protein
VNNKAKKKEKTKLKPSSDLKENKKKKSFELRYDKLCQCYVFEILDTDALLPMQITGVKFEKSYTLVQTQKGKLQLR